MGKAIGGSWLAILLTALTGQPAPIVRDHRETPGRRGQLADLPQALQHGAPRASRHVVVRRSRVGRDTSGRGPRVLRELHAAGGEDLQQRSRRDPVRQRVRETASSQRECEFRLVPGVRGLVPAGSGDRRFAIYSIPANRYLVYRPLPALLGVPAALTLRWQATASGRPPGNVAARADFVAEDLFFTASSAGDTTPTLYLTIKNIGNVRSSASQREMKIRVRGQEKDFVVLQPVAPCATLRNPLRFDGALGHCEEVLVELDTRTGLKFQVGEGAFPNADVFANDRSAMRARDTRAAEHSRGRAISVNCDPGRIVR
jgi:hypothetical protein